jgi:hypothetical protein
MKLGADRKKTALLGILVFVLAVFAYFQLFSSGPTGEQRPAAGNRATAANADERPAGTGPSSRQQPPDISRAAALRSARAKSESAPGEFRPSLEHQNLDPMRADPTLHTDLMAKVQAVALAGGERNLFQFGAPPPPKPITPDPKDPKIVPGQPGGPATAAAGGLKAIPTAPPVTADPPAPPLPLKFYGFTEQARQSNKRAFFLNGDDIIVAGEGDVVMKRYKVVRIGVNSVVMEDMETKKQQPLPLEEQPG